MGHHGSRYSTGRELLEQIRPEIALISVGRHNGYGHPDPGTVERLLAAGGGGVPDRPAWDGHRPAEQSLI